MNAMLLAAGKGDRIAEAAGGRPKVLMEINGESLLEHNIRLLQKHAVKKVVINTHYRAEMIKDFLERRNDTGMEFVLSHEPFLLGTAGGVKNAALHLGDKPFLVLYGDNFSDFDLSDLLRTHERRTPAVTLGVFDPDQCLHSGVLAGHVTLDHDGRVLNFVEKRGSEAVPKGSKVNAGVMMLNPGVLDSIPPNKPWDFSRDVFPELLESGALIWSNSKVSYVLASDTPEAHKRASALARENNLNDSRPEGENE